MLVLESLDRGSSAVIMNISFQIFPYNHLDENPVCLAISLQHIFNRVYKSAVNASGRRRIVAGDSVT